MENPVGVAPHTTLTSVVVAAGSYWELLGKTGSVRAKEKSWKVTEKPGA